MKCPKCDSAMNEVFAAYREKIDRCDHCHGLFVGRDALELMERHWFLWPKMDDTGHIDSGDPEIGKYYDEIGDIDCPACGKRMVAISMDDQPHIWVEQCPTCEGVYFDAGELTDLRYNTMVDWVRDFLKGPRRAPGV